MRSAQAIATHSVAVALTVELERVTPPASAPAATVRTPKLQAELEPATAVGPARSREPARDALLER